MDAEKQSRLNVACFLLLIKVRRQHGSFSEWRAFAEWLGGYQYVLPDERTLSYILARRLLDLIMETSASDMFTIYTICCDAEVHLTLAEQHEVIQRILI